MAGNGKVFVSHAHADNELCAPLVAQLKSWGIDYWFDLERMDAGSLLDAGIQHALKERDILVRICTAATNTSYYMHLERSAFIGLAAQEFKAGHDTRRRVVNVRMDGAYEFQPFDYAYVFIDATSGPEGAWLTQLHHALQHRSDADVVVVEPIDVGNGDHPGPHYAPFFDALIAEMRDRHHWATPKKAGEANACVFPSGIPGIAYGVVFPKGNHVRAELYIGRTEGNLSKVLFDSLLKDRTAIESAYGGPLQWERLDTRKACRVAIYRNGSIKDSPQQLDTYRQWAAEQLVKLRHAFDSPLKQLMNQG